MARHVNDKVRSMGYRGWLQWMVSQKLGWGDLKIPWHQAQGDAIQAHVTEGLWFAYCPDTSCRTPVIVDDQEPFLFCVNCLNVANEGKPYPVVFTGKRQIEELFARRMDPRTRNWYPGESIEDLRNEQAQRGEL